MKILYDLGQYEPKYVEFEISSLILDDFIRVVGKPIAIGQTKSVGRNRSAKRYLNSLLKRVYSASYFEKRWERVRVKHQVSHKSIGFTAAVYATDKALYLDKKDYVAYMLKQQKKTEKKNELINNLLLNFHD